MTEKITSYEKGIQSEKAAICFLEQKGYELLAQRYKTEYGEIDLIVSKEDTLAFVEVKHRKKYEDAAESVTTRQQLRIQNAAEIFLQANPHLASKYTFIRFDVVLICNTKPPVHLENAWQMNG